MSRLTFRVHALQRMFERGIRHDDITTVLQMGEVIRYYHDDKPYPSRLYLGWVAERPLHVIVAETDTEQGTIVITVYEPDPQLWDADFKNKLERD